MTEQEKSLKAKMNPETVAAFVDMARENARLKLENGRLREENKKLKAHIAGEWAELIANQERGRLEDTAQRG
jgi:cell division protein FtsB